MELRAVLADPTSLAPSHAFAYRFVCKRTIRGRRIAVVIEESPVLQSVEAVPA